MVHVSPRRAPSLAVLVCSRETLSSSSICFLADTAPYSLLGSLFESIRVKRFVLSKPPHPTLAPSRISSNSSQRTAHDQQTQTPRYQHAGVSFNSAWCLTLILPTGESHKIIRAIYILHKVYQGPLRYIALLHMLFFNAF